MRALHLCFWLHHPYELNDVEHWQKGYFGGEADFRRADEQDYQPLFALLERNAQRYPHLRVSLVVSGVWLEQAERWDKELVKRLQKLVKSGKVALVATPYYYSMAVFYDLDELAAQLKQYQEKLEQLFETRSDYLALPGLCYNNRIARWADKQGYQVILAGDASAELDWRTCNRVYEAKGTDGLKVLFANRPLTEILGEAQPETTAQIVAEKKSPKVVFSAQKFQKQLDLAFLRGNLVNLYLDVAIFGKWRERGIIGFFDELFKIWQETSGSHMVSVREIAKLAPVAEVSIKRTASFAEAATQDYQWPVWWSEEKDQNSQALYKLQKSIVASEDKDLYYDFGKLTTLELAQGGANYDAILKDLQERTEKLVAIADDEKAEPVRFGLAESTTVKINFDNKTKEAKERGRSFYKQMKEAAGEPLWTAEDMDDMEAAIQVMAQRMKMSHVEQERDFADFAEAEIVGTEDDFLDWPMDDIDLAAETLAWEAETSTKTKESKNGAGLSSFKAKTKDAKTVKPKKAHKKIVID